MFTCILFFSLLLPLFLARENPNDVTDNIDVSVPPTVARPSLNERYERKYVARGTALRVYG